MRHSDKRYIDDLFNFLDEAQGKIKDKTTLPPPNFEDIKQELSEPQRTVFESEQQVNVFLAGQGSGKTHLGGIISGRYISLFPEVRGMIAANTYQQLTQSTLFRIREVWKEVFNWQEYNPYSQKGEYVVGIKPPQSFDTKNHNYDKYHNIISFKHGAVLYYGSLDNYKALDGKEVAWAILDETKDTKEEAVKEVILGRLRQMGIIVNDKDFNPLYLLTSPAKVQWLNEWFSLEDFETEILSKIFSKEDFFYKDIDNKRVVISSTYHNKKNLPRDYIPNQKANLNTALQDMLIYGSPFSKSGGEFYKGFDRARHVGQCKYNPELPLHISFDFNVNPYITLLISQIQDKAIYFINEICLKSPRNNTHKLCLEFIRQYQGHEAGLFIYGDPSGKQEDTRSERGYNDYTIIKNTLRQFKPHLRIESKHPAVVPRGNFINQVLERELQGIIILIDSRCKNLITDLSYLKEASDGTKHKERERKNGVSYEKYGHCADALDYLLTSAFKNEYIKYLRGGKEKRTWTLGKYFKNKDR